MKNIRQGFKIAETLETGVNIDLLEQKKHFSVKKSKTDLKILAKFYGKASVFICLTKNNLKINKNKYFVYLGG